MKPDLIEIVTWGYETGGDRDEAARVYFENAQRSGIEIEPLADEEEAYLKHMFEIEFGSPGEEIETINQFHTGDVVLCDYLPALQVVDKIDIRTSDWDNSHSVFYLLKNGAFVSENHLSYPKRDI